MHEKEVVSVKDENETLRIFFENIIKWSTLLLIFFLPILINPLSGQIFAIPKVIFLRLMSLIIFLSWLILISSGKSSFKRSFLDLPISLFLFFAGLSTIFSVHLHTAFYGEYMRYDGFLALLIYAFLYFVTVNFFRTSGDRKVLLVVLFASACIVAAFGIINHFYLGLFNYGSPIDLGRSGSLLGNSNYLGAYLALVVPLALVSMVYLKQINLPKWLVCLTFFLTSTSLVLTYTRASWLGITVGLLCLILINKESFFKSKRAIFLSLTIVILIVAIFFGANFLGQKNLSSLPFAGRLSSLFNLKGGSVLDRLFIWKTAVKIVPDYRLLGVGPDCFGLVYPRYLQPNWASVAVNAFTDNAHFNLLQVLVCQGIAGLLSYVWIFSLFFFVTWKKIIKMEKGSLRAISIGLLCACVAYFVNIQFSFTMVYVTPIFWIIMGLLVGLVQGGDVSESAYFKEFKLPEKKKLLQGFVVILTAVFLSIGINTGTKAFLADTFLGNAFRRIEKNDLSGELNQNLLVIKNDPYEERYWFYLGRTYLRAFEVTEEEGMLSSSIFSFEEAIKRNPLDILGYWGLARSYYLGGIILNESMFDKSISAIQNGLEVEPYSLNLWFELGEVYERKGLDEEAAKAYAKVLEIEKDNYKAKEKIRLIKERE
ncbi:O-antigen ligase family protein [Candidatus Oleimmundimicrobium sp.]|uniref:O-antigen ligase family protein n=1 Tax=Candidatus Oleimmundimicrobium sp. TaxID=3060597 RepID=UPI00271B5D53|nr:O-antigen ligase family protein [Candidatus Oleimmundimicrobium sp.]MDO8886470.1 O-antigen ligase family protein [Candidatus Oleimmundimicrobium sp.]